MYCLVGQTYIYIDYWVIYTLTKNSHKQILTSRLQIHNYHMDYQSRKSHIYWLGVHTNIYWLEGHACIFSLYLCSWVFVNEDIVKTENMTSRFTQRLYCPIPPPPSPKKGNSQKPQKTYMHWSLNRHGHLLWSCSRICSRSRRVGWRKRTWSTFGQE